MNRMTRIYSRYAYEEARESYSGKSPLDSSLFSANTVGLEILAQAFDIIPMPDGSREHDCMWGELRVDIKMDFRAEETENLYYEKTFNGKPSAALTNSDVYAFIFRYAGYSDTVCIFMVPCSWLKKYKGKDVVSYNGTTGTLIPLNTARKNCIEFASVALF